MPSVTFKCNRSNPKNAVGKLRKKTVYTPSMIGFDGVKGDGLGVRICIIDTGYPRHENIPFSASNTIDFTSSKSAAKDTHGHGTGVAGILKAHGGSIEGMVPKAEIFYAKGLSDEGEGSHGAVQASILYAIVKQVDIIVMSFGSEIRHPTLHDAIKKAYHSGISLFAASGQTLRSTKNSDYPARFPEVMSVGYSSTNFPTAGSSDAPHIAMPIKGLQTTFLGDKFIKMNGTSAITPAIAGVAAILLQNNRSVRQANQPGFLYDKLISLCRPDRRS